MFIYHITSEKEWQAALLKGEYLPKHYSTDGFIHCSTKEQVVRTANKFYPGKNGLVLLKIDTDLVKAKVKEENLEGGVELFPHIYGPLPVSAVVVNAPFVEISQKGFIFPAAII